MYIACPLRRTVKNKMNIMPKNTNNNVSAKLYSHEAFLRLIEATPNDTNVEFCCLIIGIELNDKSQTNTEEYT